jgi:mannose-6-phosphate isomerase-like protein (cupin superfamily)
MPEPIEVQDVKGGKSTVRVSNFGGFPDEGICGYRDEWQPGILHVVSFHDSKPHYHDDKEEIFLVLEGSGKIILGGVEVNVSKWDTVMVPRFVEHMGIPDPRHDLVVAVFFIDRLVEGSDPEASARLSGEGSNG